MGNSNQECLNRSIDIGSIITSSKIIGRVQDQIILLDLYVRIGKSITGIIVDREIQIDLDPHVGIAIYWNCGESIIERNRIFRFPQFNIWIGWILNRIWKQIVVVGAVIDANSIVWILNRVACDQITVGFNSINNYSIVVVIEGVIPEGITTTAWLPADVTIVKGIVDYLSVTGLVWWALENTIITWTIPDTVSWTIPENIVPNYCVWRWSCEIDTEIIHIKHTIPYI